ncbi:MAG: carboxypeptidase-like regulatory domain-containing protein, partial [Minisyncoccia bacterium]
MRPFLFKSLFVAISIFCFSGIALAGNIDATDKIAKGFNNDIGSINFNVATTSGSTTLSVNVTDTEVTGYAFGENIGWINLHSASTTSWGVENDGNGNLSGYAWSTNIGWINFDTASTSVTIDSNGYFHGYAWNNVKGWISFNCEDVETDIASTTYCADNNNYKVRTTWDASTLSVTCSGSPSSLAINGNVVWTAVPLDGSGYTYSWSGTDSLSGTNSTTSLTYTTSGTKNAFITVTSGLNTATSTCSILVNSGGGTVVDTTLTCTNGATNYPTCDNICTNGATNFPTCDNNVCTNGATNFPTCNNICTNGATNYPTCDNICTNGATNYPVCDNNVIPTCTNGSSNYPACDNNIPPEEIVPPVITPPGGEPTVPGGGGNDCSNGATNYPTCDNVCVNEATNYPTCDNVCTNGATNYPDCDNSIAGTPCPSGYSGVYPNCQQETVVTAAIQQIGDGFIKVKELVNTQAGDITVKTLSTAGVAVSGAVAVSTLFLNPMSFTEILLIPFRLWGLLVSFLGLKRRSRPWGTVYDSITKQPLDPAYVVLQDMLGKEITTSITDLDGRYGFFAFPGRYKIVANKTNYIFPSKRLAGQTVDELYKDLYFGDVLDIQQEGEIIAKNIPLDPEKFDWNEVAKRNMKVMRFYSKYDLIFKKASNIFFIAGLFVAIIALLSAPYVYNIVIFSLYVVMIILRVFGIRPKYFGWVLDKTTGFPMSFAIVHIYSDDLQRELTKKVCDSSGRYYA